MDSSPRISVIIPTHNGADTLAACLQSLRCSSLPPFEIIVVDDASSDGSADIARRFDCRVVTLADNIGAARAKNRGADMASGDIIFFTDDDVMVSPDALANVAATCVGETAGVVGLLAREIPFRNLASNYKNLWMRFTYARLPRERIGVFYTSVAAIRREVFLGLGGFDENYTGASIAEDTEFGQRAWVAGQRIDLQPSVVVTHHKHYTFRQVLQTDFLRARALVLMRLRKWGQGFFTSVPSFYQVAVPTVLSGLVSIVLWILFLNPLFILLALLFTIGFYALNAAWIAYLARELGARDAFLAALFQPVDTLVVGAGMFKATVEFMQGTRY